MNKKFLKLLLLSSLLLSSWSLFSQINLAGKVKSKTSDESLVGAHCKVLETSQITVTDVNGKFNLNLDKPGNYHLQITYLGMKTLNQQVKVYGNSNYLFVLIDSLILEDEVIIMASRSDNSTANTFENISKASLRQRNFGQDLPLILQNSPSMVVSSDAGNGIGYTSMRIRGTDVTRINFSINGIPLNDPESNGVWFVNMPDFASSLHSIQIQRGAGSSTVGTAAFGAGINMLTSDYNPQAGAEVSTSFGSFNTQLYRLQASSGLLNSKFTFDTRFSSIHSDGYIDRAKSDLKSFYASAARYGKRSLLRFNFITGNEKTYQSWNGVPKVRLENNEAGMLEYLNNGSYSQEEYNNLLNSGSRTYNLYTYKNETDNYQQTHFQLIYSKELNSKFTLNSAFHYTLGNGYYENYKANTKFLKYGIENPIIGSDTLKKTDLIQQKWLDNSFYGGNISAIYKSAKSKIIVGISANQYIGYHFGEVVWSKIALMGDHFEWYRSQGIKSESNIFGKYTLDIFSNLRFFADLQYRMVEYSIRGIDDDLKDISSTHSFRFLNPKLGFNYALNQHNELFISAAIANREPSRSNYTDADETNEPKAEELLDFELGYTFKNQKLNFSANGFYMLYNNQLVETGKVNNVGAAIMTNVAKSYRTGLELMASIWISKSLSWSLNATFSENKIENFVEYVDDWDNGGQISKELGKTDISFSPNIVGSSIITYSFRGLPQISLISKYVDKQFIDNTSNSSRSIDAYFVNDLKFSYNLSINKIKGLQLSFTINNILNTKYETSAWAYRYLLGGNEYVMDGYFPQSGTNFFGSISINF